MTLVDLNRNSAQRVPYRHQDSMVEVAKRVRPTEIMMPPALPKVVENAAMVRGAPAAWPYSMGVPDMSTAKAVRVQMTMVSANTSNTPKQP